MYRSKTKKLIILVLLFAGVIQAGMMVYSAIADGTMKKHIEEDNYTIAQNSASSDVTVQKVEIPKEEIDISKVILKEEVVEKITSLDAANALKNISNYKMLLAALNIPGSFQVQIEDMYNNGHKVPDVLIAFDYLYQNYGNIEELELLIRQKESGNEWKSIFKEYRGKQEEFIPRNFQEGKLEEIYKISGITADDVIIADRISQLTGLIFDDLITMRGQGKDWKTINESLGIVNTSGELPRVAVTSAQVKNHIKSTGLSEKQIIEALVLAQKLDRDEKSTIEKIKSGITEEDIIAESLKEKYQ